MNTFDKCLFVLQPLGKLIENCVKNIAATISEINVAITLKILLCNDELAISRDILVILINRRTIKLI